MDTYENRLVYHITHIDNLESIIQNGLLSTNKKKDMNVSHVNIANKSIQETRSEMVVPCGPGGTIHDYVPFYFASRTPMLLGVINTKNYDQPLMVYLCLKLDVIDKGNAVFTDASANTKTPPNFYDKKEHLDNLDWEIIDSEKWSFDEDARHKHMAELLVKDKVRIEDVYGIVVFNDYIKKKVLDIFLKHSCTPPNIYFSGFNNHHFWYTKFNRKNRENEQLLTGPVSLKEECENKKILLVNRLKTRKKDCRFKDVKECVENIPQFINDIDYLQPMNSIIIKYGYQNNKTIGQHSTEVVNCLKNQEKFSNYSTEDRNILLLGAILHDTGKIRDLKNDATIDRPILDHAADSLRYAACFIYNEIENISEEEIRKLLMLVTYHDIIGDCLGKGRNWSQIINIINDEKDYRMLVSIGRADIEANSNHLLECVDEEIPSLTRYVYKCLKQEE